MSRDNGTRRCCKNNVFQGDSNHHSHNEKKYLWSCFMERDGKVNARQEMLRVSTFIWFVIITLPIVIQQGLLYMGNVLTECSFLLMVRHKESGIRRSGSSLVHDEGLICCDVIMTFAGVLVICGDIKARRRRIGFKADITVITLADMVIHH